MLSNSDSGRWIKGKGKDWRSARIVIWQTGRRTGCAGDFFEIGTACHVAYTDTQSVDCTSRRDRLVDMDVLIAVLMTNVQRNVLIISKSEAISELERCNDHVFNNLDC